MGPVLCSRRPCPLEEALRRSCLPVDTTPALALWESLRMMPGVFTGVAVTVSRVPESLAVPLAMMGPGSSKGAGEATRCGESFPCKMSGDGCNECREGLGAAEETLRADAGVRVNI